MVIEGNLGVFWRGLIATDAQPKVVRRSYISMGIAEERYGAMVIVSLFGAVHPTLKLGASG